MIDVIKTRKVYVRKSPDRQITRFLNLIILLPLLLAGCVAYPAAFTPRQPIAPDQYSHRQFEEVLREHVHQDGMVDYPAIAKDVRFTSYVAQLDHVDPNAFPTKEERLAFWINAYNAFAIQGILDGFSPQSLWGRYEYFIKCRYRVGGEETNLYDLERSILIKQFHEPRIHFAIVCASRSCPKLRAEAYSAADLRDQLDAQARDFINDPSKNQFDGIGRTARLSKIFDWYDDEFIAHSGSLGEYVARYVTDPELRRDLAANRYDVEFIRYDWRLNGPAPVKGEARSQDKAQGK